MSINFNEPAGGHGVKESMLSIKQKLLVLVTTFTLGLAAVSLTVQLARIAQFAKEPPPCDNCALFYKTPIREVTVSDLTEHPEKYRGHVVRVRAAMHHDAGALYIVNGGVLHVGLAESCRACRGAMKALRVNTGFHSWYDDSASVVVLGRVGPLENPTLFPDDNGFNIDCVESVKANGSDAFPAIRYAIGKLFDELFRVW